MARVRWGNVAIAAALLLALALAIAWLRAGEQAPRFPQRPAPLPAATVATPPPAEQAPPARRPVRGAGGAAQPAPRRDRARGRRSDRSRAVPAAPAPAPVAPRAAPPPGEFALE
jgi:hypothetical protein